jgi:hypothetical protein
MVFFGEPKGHVGPDKASTARHENLHYSDFASEMIRRDLQGRQASRSCKSCCYSPVPINGSTLSR